MSNQKILNQLVKGAGILFIALILGRFLAFLFKVVLARYLGPSEYGVLSLGLTFFGVLTILSLSGLSSAVKRFVNMYYATKDLSKTKGVVLASIKMSLIMGLILMTLLLLFSEFFAVSIFKEIKLISLLRIFAFALPFQILLKLNYDLFLAFHKPKYMAFFEFFIEKLLLFILVFMMLILDKGINFVAFMYIIVAVIGLLISSLLFHHKIFSLNDRKLKADYNYKEILMFSLPLTMVGVMGLVLNWSDNFFLGYYMSAAQVGIYNVAFPLAVALPLFYSSFALVFYPKITELYSQKKIKIIRQIFSTVNNWIFFFTFPIFLIFVFFAKPLINLLFGSQYTSAYLVLIILSFGFFINSITGMVSQLLQAYGKTKFIFLINLIAVLLNISLNIILIPIWGIYGAAYATAFCIVFRDLSFWIKTRSLLRFKVNIIKVTKSVLASSVSLILVYLLHQFIHLKSFFVIIYLIFYILFYILLLLVLNSFDPADFQLLNTIFIKLGIKNSRILNLIKRFIK